MTVSDGNKMAARMGREVRDLSIIFNVRDPVRARLLPAGLSQPSCLRNFPHSAARPATVQKTKFLLRALLTNYACANAHKGQGAIAWSEDNLNVHT